MVPSEGAASLDATGVREAVCTSSPMGMAGVAVAAVEGPAGAGTSRESVGGGSEETSGVAEVAAAAAAAAAEVGGLVVVAGAALFSEGFLREASLLGVEADVEVGAGD